MNDKNEDHKKLEEESRGAASLSSYGGHHDPHYSTGFWGQSLEIMHKEELCSVHLAHSGRNSCSSWYLS